MSSPAVAKKEKRAAPVGKTTFGCWFSAAGTVVALGVAAICLFSIQEILSDIQKQHKASLEFGRQVREAYYVQRDIIPNSDHSSCAFQFYHPYTGITETIFSTCPPELDDPWHMCDPADQCTRSYFDEETQMCKYFYVECQIDTDDMCTESRCKHSTGQCEHTKKKCPNEKPCIIGRGCPV